MRRAIALAAVAALAGCATGGADGPALPLARLEQAAVPGAGKTQVQATLGAATRVAFKDGREVWMYRYAGEDGAGDGEYVLLFGADGALLKTRRGPVWTAERQ